MEPGIWAAVPSTTNPLLGHTVARMASIPHGTTVLAQGLSIADVIGGPQIDPIDIFPFTLGKPSEKFTTFPEQTLANATQFRSPAADIVGITQAMVDNPNSLLLSDISAQKIVKTSILLVSTDPAAPVLGGGTDNTAFLQGSPSAGPNAQGTVVSAIFWIEHVDESGAEPVLQLQYTQRVQLVFGGLSWPHVTVAMLRKHRPRR